MSVSKSRIRIVLSAICVTLLAACSATELQPGAERIIVSKKEAPKGCKFLGAVIGEQGGAIGGAWTSNKNLAEGALNDMRNKALGMGANFVQLETNQAGVTGSGSFYSHSQQQTDVTNTGNAYKCPPEEIGL